MFLTRMISGLICSKNTTENVNKPSQPSQQSKSLKSNKKQQKCKRTESKKSFAELLKNQIKEPQNRKELPSTSKAMLRQARKVKSASWKRSEKSISSHNTISGKKSKSLRRRSPTWFKFPNSSVKVGKEVTVSLAESASVYRPGTLYSDVLFGAGSASQVKIKNLTARRSSINNAQQKLTKALLKCTGKESAISGSELETKRKYFPSLNDRDETVLCKGNRHLVNRTLTPNGSSKMVSNPNANSGQCDDEADVIILSETEGVLNSENGFTALSYGNYLEQDFKPLNGSIPNLTEKSQPPLFSIDIPQWNYTEIDLSSDTYPKFLGQFEDEHYLMLEKMALQSLRSALGNNSQF